MLFVVDDCWLSVVWFGVLLRFCCLLVLFIGCCLLCGIRWLLFVVFVDRFLFVVGSCLLSLLIDCCLMFIARCLLLDDGCYFLHVVGHWLMWFAVRRW